ncbi:hypothetical protein E4U17_002071 [Claviceps sp. LM77 group G4]|nr:hypothetical protein E4U17_002071 [Claviceps sp. LM77 group G4]
MSTALCSISEDVDSGGCMPQSLFKATSYRVEVEEASASGFGKVVTCSALFFTFDLDPAFTRRDSDFQTTRLDG